MVRLQLGLLGAALFGAAFAAPVQNTTIQQDRVIPNSWILSFKENVPDSELHTFKKSFRKRAEIGNIEIHHEYDLGPGMLKGYFLKGPAETVMPLNDSQWVSQIEPNMAYHRPWRSNVDEDDDDDKHTLVPRVDIRPLSNRDNLWNLEQISGGHKGQYHCPDGCGEGTFIYIIDDGIDHDHPEFAGRIVSEQHFHEGIPEQYQGTQGTFVAGIAAGKVRGVAPNAKIVMLNIFGEQNAFRLDWFLKAMEWAVDDIKARNRVGKAVINISHWGGPAAEGQSAVRAVADAVRSGIFVAVAAGDWLPDAGSTWPQAEDTACVVGAMTWHPGYWHHGARGPKIDLAAPGVEVRSASAKGHRSHHGDFMRASGTYAAAPHVAGVAATVAALAKGRFTDMSKMCDLLRCWAIDPGDNWPANTPRRRLLNMRTADLDDGTPEAEMLKRPECQNLLNMNRTFVGLRGHPFNAF